MSILFRTQLPLGYVFADKATVKPDEIMYLREMVGWAPDSDDRWRQVIDSALVLLTVRDSKDVLVGMAVLAGNVRHAVMCDLVVHPSHQRKGIGEAIMGRLDQATYEVGVSYVYAELAKTNPFKERMLRAGFNVTGESLFRAQ